MGPDLRWRCGRGHRGDAEPVQRHLPARRLLERSGLNHECAEAASVPGGRLDPRHLSHDPDWRACLDPPPSAAGGSGDSPTGWGLIEHLVGYVWPNGHQDRLLAAADAWAATGAALDAATDALSCAAITIAIVTSPEVDDALTVLRGVQVHYHELARAHRRLAGACRRLAQLIDEVHSGIEHELVEMLVFIGGAEVVGALASTVTFGLAEGPTQAEVAARIGAAVEAISGFFETFTGAVDSVLTLLPAAEDIARTVTFATDRLLGLRPVAAAVSGARALPAETRTAKLMLSARREAAAEQRLAQSAQRVTNSVEKQASPIWRQTKPYRGKTRTNGLAGKKKRFYEWDHTHKDIEVYDQRRNHLGTMDPTTGRMIKPAVPDRRLNDGS